MAHPLLIAVMGPTSSGKTTLAEKLALAYDAQLVNADAFQVYRGFDIGTGKPAPPDKYELLDVADPSEQFGLGEWVTLAVEVLQQNWDRDRSVVLVGGTGLYMRALAEQYSSLVGKPAPELRMQLMEEERIYGTGFLLDKLSNVRPDLAARVDSGNPLRVRRALERALTPSQSIDFKLPPFAKLKFAIDLPKEVNAQRIRVRVDKMLKSGWPEEVRQIRDSGVTYDAPAMRAIGYKSLWDHLEGNISMEEAVSSIHLATIQYSKRQRTWLRSEPNLKLLQHTTMFEEAELAIRSAIEN